jgi:Uma2 family endonuclease
MPTVPLPIPETKPATEFIDGRLVQKMSPYGLHARVQGAMVTALTLWSNEGARGRVGTEWDFDLTPPGDATHRLVPDVAYVSYERVAFDDDLAAQVPVVAPNVAVEILSSGQTLQNSRRRIDILIACGAQLVVLVDPRAEQAWLVDPSGTRSISREESIDHAALPGFSLPLRQCFDRTAPLPLRIPETKPATEFIDGRLARKMSPYGLHAFVQLAIAAPLRDWARRNRCGRVGTEWDFDLTLPGQPTNRLVPDVAYLSYSRVAFEDAAWARVPSVAPNVAVEILSEGQNLKNTARRVEIFLECGTELVLLIDPRMQQAWAIDAGSTRHLTMEGTIEHDALPGFALRLSECFEEPGPDGIRP